MTDPGSRNLCLVLGMTALLSGLAFPAQSQGPATTGTALAIRVAVPQISPFRQAIAIAAAEDAEIAAFFRDRDYAPFWTSADGAARRAALLSALAEAPLHALPTTHDPAPLLAAFAKARSEGDRGRLEVAMSRAFLAFARDLSSGVVEPGRVDGGIVRTVERPDPRALLDGFAAAEPAAFLRGLAPRHPEYARLLKAHARLRAQIAAGGWGPPVRAKALRPGDTGAEVVALRDRLAAMGHLGRTATATYDSAVQSAVQRFQFEHGLVADGIAHEATIAQINVGPEDRLRAVIVAMERERWMNHDRGARHIVVNLTDFTAKIIDDGIVTFATRAVIGSTVSDKQTPEFSHRMTYMELNPDWTVPPGIIRRDYLPRLQSNPNALRHLQVVDSRGRVVPRDQIDFSAYSSRNFPFNLRQPPGASNALGRVKFMFPNPWSIYLHDTPEKHLFARDRRAYSSGCVRLNDPFDFAYVLLSRQEEDPRRAFHRVLDTGRQERIFLKDPVPIHIDYRTAFTDARGRVHYRADIYGRDAAIHAALLRAGVEG
ncbi:MAG: murein L,D-transpeptidase [Gemmobacter sp.]